MPPKFWVQIHRKTLAIPQEVSKVFQKKPMLFPTKGSLQSAADTKQSVHVPELKEIKETKLIKKIETFFVMVCDNIELLKAFCGCELNWRMKSCKSHAKTTPPDNRTRVKLSSYDLQRARANDCGHDPNKTRSRMCFDYFICVGASVHVMR